MKRVLRSAKARVRTGIRWLHELRRKGDSLQRRVAYRRWLNGFSRSTAELLIGANFDMSGGVRNHILGIQRYTSLTSLLVPSDKSVRKCGLQCFLENSESFLRCNPPYGVTVLHSHVSPWFIEWCMKHRERGRLRWVHTHHALYFEDVEPGGMPEWQRLLNEAGIRALVNCDAALCVSPSQQRLLKSLHGIESTYLPNGVDIDVCDSGSAGEFRKKHGISGDFILWLGRKETVKNPRDLLLAALRLRELQFVMVIDALDEDDLERVTGIAVPENVRLLNPISRVEAQHALAACSAVVITSLREGLPTLALEALAHRAALVVSDAEGCLDATDAGSLAHVYPRGNIDRLCDRIGFAVSLGQDREPGRRFVQEKFDWKVLARRLDAVYRGRE